MKTYQIATDYESLVYVIADNIVEAHKKFRDKFLAYISNEKSRGFESTTTKVRNIHSITKSEYDILQDNLKDGVNFNMTLYMVTYEPNTNTNQELSTNLIALSNSQSLEKILKTNIIKVEAYTYECIVIN